MTNQKTILKTYTLERVLTSSRKYELEKTIRSPHDAANVFKQVFRTEGMTKEHLLMASLNTKNKIEGLHIVHIGSLNTSIVHPRDVFQLAILDNAASIILAHNHPSGDTTPSPEDIEVTKRLKEVGTLLGIEVLDHIILGEDFTSLKDKGCL